MDNILWNIVLFVLKFAIAVQKNVTCLKISIARIVHRLAEIVLMNVEEWQVCSYKNSFYARGCCKIY
jgi:hypothetical protein